MALACEDANSKLVEVVTVAADDSELKSGKILKLDFGYHFAADILWKLWSLILDEILKLGFG